MSDDSWLMFKMRDQHAVWKSSVHGWDLLTNGLPCDVIGEEPALLLGTLNIMELLVFSWPG